MDALVSEARVALRRMRRDPLFTLIAVATLAFGIGANVALFTVVNAVLLNPIPVEDPNRLVNIYTTDESVDIAGFHFLPFSFRNFEDVTDENESLESVSFSAPVQVVLTEQGDPRSVSGYIAGERYFEVLGLEPAVGRFFSREESREGAGLAVAVLSHAIWRDVFGGDPRAVGETIRLNGEPYTVIGVAPPGFRGTTTLVDAEQIWLPAGVYAKVLDGVRRDRFLDRRGLFVNVFGRLRPGVSFDEANENIRSLGSALAEEFPSANQNRSFELGLLSQAARGSNAYRSADESGTTARAAVLLMAVAGIVLLVACMNLASLLLARGADREKELSVRAELGASPSRLVRMLLTESLLLAGISGLAGLSLASWGRDALWALRPPALSSALVSVSFDNTVLLFAVAVTLFTGLLFGTLPAIGLARTRDLHGLLKQGGRRGTGQETGAHLRRGLVAFEVTFAFVALVAAGLFVQSLRQGAAIDPGFDPESVFTVTFDFANRSELELVDRRTALYDDLLESVRSVPGVEDAALSQRAPVAISPYRAVLPEGEVDDPTAFGPAVTVNVVSVGYFETLGMRLAEGRAFTPDDRSETRAVAVVSRALARRYWPFESAVGKRLRFSGTGTDSLFEVVGVFEDAVVRNILEEPAPALYLPLTQSPAPASVLTVRAQRSQDSVVGSVRRSLRDADASLAITEERAVSDAIAEGMWGPRVGATLLGAFGGLAIVLAAIGVYGVLAHTVTRRQHEVGIRLVLGAERSQIYLLLLLQSVGPALFGIGLGVVAAAGLAPLAGGLLYRVSPYDTWTYCLSALLLFLVSVTACLLPVRSALNLAPMEAVTRE